MPDFWIADFHKRDNYGKYVEVTAYGDYGKSLNKNAQMTVMEEVVELCPEIRYIQCNGSVLYPMGVDLVDLGIISMEWLVKKLNVENGVDIRRAG